MAVLGLCEETAFIAIPYTDIQTILIIRTWISNNHERFSDYFYQRSWFHVVVTIIKHYHIWYDVWDIFEIYVQ